jgi:integrase/recombinase XerD
MITGPNALNSLAFRKWSQQLPNGIITKSNQGIDFVIFLEASMKQARVLTQAEIKRVLTYCNGTKHPIRNRLAVMLSHYAGLRVGEIAALTWDQLVDANGDIRNQFYLEAQTTKSNEARLVHVNIKLAAELKAAQKLVNTKNGPVIRSQRGGHFSANSLAQVFARLYASVGFTDASSHSGRRWFITELAKKGVTSKAIMELAGHKQLSTTQRYIEVTDQMKAEAVQLL